jgi:hypothetical protein
MGIKDPKLLKEQITAIENNKTNWTYVMAKDQLVSILIDFTNNSKCSILI